MSHEQHLDATDEMVRFVVRMKFEDLPEVAKEKATAAIADTIGVIHLGASSEVAEKALEALSDAGSLNGSVRLLAQDESANALDAALYHGIAAHALDFDDVNHPGPMHPSCHLVPALLSAATIRPVSGKDFLAAYLVGFEIDAKFAISMNPKHYDEGWHSTSTMGAVAAAGAVANLFGLDELQTQHCLSLAASSASGLRGNIGSMAKPLHAGLAARSGLLAGLFARRGYTGMTDILDRRHGYLSAFGDGPAAYLPRIAELGRTWEIETEFGLGLKPFPCCGEATSVVEGALQFHDEISPEEIDRVIVATNERATKILAYPRPVDVEQARFSLPYCFAAPFVLGRADESAFGEHQLDNPTIQAVLEKVEHEISAEHRDEREYGAYTRVLLKDGRTFERDIPVTKGWSHRWLTTAEQQAKFVACTATVMAEADARTLFERLQVLADESDVSTLVLRPAVPRD